MRLIFALSLLLTTSFQAAALELGDVVVGPARVIDGDTLSVQGVRIRLHGVAAPERNEPGGPEATAFMTQMTDGKTVRCSLTGEKTHKREVGTCWVEAMDIAAQLIAAGLARDCPRFSSGRYAALETPDSKKLPFPSYCQPRR